VSGPEQWCADSSETLLRVLREGFDFQVRDVTSLASSSSTGENADTDAVEVDSDWLPGRAELPKECLPSVNSASVGDTESKANSNDASSSRRPLVDYEALYKKLGVAFDKSAVPTDSTSSADGDALLGVYYVTVEKRTWERRGPAKERLEAEERTQRDHGGEAAFFSSLPFVDQQAMVCSAVVEELARSEPGVRTTATGTTPLCCFLLELRRKVNPDRLFCVFVDVVLGNSGRLKTILTVVKPVLVKAVACLTPRSEDSAPSPPGVSSVEVEHYATVQGTVLENKLIDGSFSV
jgi:hypothetical protein